MGQDMGEISPGSSTERPSTAIRWFGDVIKRAMEGTASPRQAIKAKCIDCSCEQKEEITDCRVKSCPLWLYRPYQKA